MHAGTIVASGEKDKKGAGAGGALLAISAAKWQPLQHVKADDADARVAAEAEATTHIITSLLQHREVRTSARSVSILRSLLESLATAYAAAEQCAPKCVMQAWQGLAEVFSTLDVLGSFADFAAAADGPTCFPAFALPPADPVGAAPPVFEAQALWHPALTLAGGACPVPNDICLGDVDESGTPATQPALLLTGPNMVRPHAPAPPPARAPTRTRLR